MYVRAPTMAADVWMDECAQRNADMGALEEERTSPWGDRINLDTGMPPATERTSDDATSTRPTLPSQVKKTVQRSAVPCVKAWEQIVAGLPNPAQTHRLDSVHHNEASKDTARKAPRTHTTTQGAVPDTLPNTRNRERSVSSPTECTPDRLGIMTLNCRGLTCNSVALSLAIEEISPNIVFLTETKIVSNQNSHVLRQLLTDYTWAISSTTRKEAKQYHTERPKAGVVIAVHKTYSARGRLLPYEPAPGLHGYVCHTGMRMQDDVLYLKTSGNASSHMSPSNAS